MSQASQPDTGLVQALHRKVKDLENRVETLEEQNEDLHATIETLQDRVPDPMHMDHDNLSKQEKATILRTKLKKMAEASRGKAAMDYKDVMQVFDGQPSPGHAYDIMEVVQYRPGFSYGQSPDGQKRVEVDLDGVKDAGGFSRREQ